MTNEKAFYHTQMQNILACMCVFVCACMCYAGLGPVKSVKSLNLFLHALLAFARLSPLRTTVFKLH